METWRIQQLVHQLGIQGSCKLQRIDLLACGAVVVVECGEQLREIVFFAAGRCTWLWTAMPAERSRLVAAIAAQRPELAVPLPELGWRDATALEALRAWILRPASGHPGWAQVGGSRLVAARQPHGDRHLDLELESADAVGRTRRTTLRFQLFAPGAGLALLDAGGAEILNARGRPLATPRPPAPGEAPAAPDGGGGSLDAAVAAYIDIAQHAASALQHARDRELGRREKRLASLLAKLDGEASAAAEAARWRQVGELLAANLHRIRRGQHRVVVEDFFSGGVRREIDIDPEVQPQENVARYFKRARRAERGQATIEARRADTRQALQQVQDDRRALDPHSTWTEVLRRAPEIWRRDCDPGVLRTPLERLWDAGGPGWQAPARTPAAVEEAGPGRRFLVPGGWEIRVGRSNEENDELTHRFAHPNDVWLHASGVAGSHVVLRMGGRSGNPPREVLEIAAAIAARFSKAKHAGTVPVLWTRKRYVRKPRGSKPGLATCTHEKTVFVRPGLPDDEG